MVYFDPERAYDAVDEYGAGGALLVIEGIAVFLVIPQMMVYAERGGFGKFLGSEVLAGRPRGVENYYEIGLFGNLRFGREKVREIAVLGGKGLFYDGQGVFAGVFDPIGVGGKIWITRNRSTISLNCLTATLKKAVITST